MAKNAEQLEQLTAYLDGELSDAERKKVETLLAQNEDARILLEELRQTSNLLASLPHAPAPAHLSDAITDQLERAALFGEETSNAIGTSSGNAWFRGLAIAASVALVCTAGWFMWPELPSMFHDEKPAFTLADAKSTQDEIDPEDMPPLDTNKRSRLRGLAYVGESDTTADPPRMQDTTKSLPAKQSRRPGTRAGGRGGAKGQPRRSLRSVEQTNLAQSDGDKDGAKQPIIVEERNAGEAITEAAKEDTPELLPSDLAMKPDQRTQETIGAAGPSRGRKGISKSHSPRTKPQKGARVAAAQPAMTNAGMRQITASEESNSLVVETDDATRKEIARYFRSFVASNNIPNARQVTFPEPIPPTQGFFIDEGEPIARTSFDLEEETSSTDEIRFVLNAPVDQVEELLHNVNLITSSNNAPTHWTANDISIASDDIPATVLGAMISPSAPIEPSERRRIAAAPASLGTRSLAQPTGTTSETADTDDDRDGDEDGTESAASPAPIKDSPPIRARDSRSDKPLEDDQEEKDTTSDKANDKTDIKAGNKGIPNRDNEQTIPPPAKNKKQSTKSESSSSSKSPPRLITKAPQRGAWVVCTPPHADKPAYIRLAILLRTIPSETPDEKPASLKEKGNVSAPPPHRPTSHPSTRETPRG